MMGAEGRGSQLEMPKEPAAHDGCVTRTELVAGREEAALEAASGGQASPFYCICSASIPMHVFSSRVPCDSCLSLTFHGNPWADWALPGLRPLLTTPAAHRGPRHRLSVSESLPPPRNGSVYFRSRPF